MSRYQPRHAMARPARRPVRTMIAVTGLTTAVAVPMMATPASAHTISTAVTTAVATGNSANPTLRYGSRGAAVAKLQRLLRISSDGIFGPQTRGAVLMYQRSHGLAVDGVVGPQTWGSLSGRAPARSDRVSRSTSRASIGARVVAEAASHVGQPYRYGAAGPSAFDCSGFVQYVFSQVGISVPRTASAQASAARRVSQSSRRPGDLIIMYSSGRVSHVAIYAGNDTMWVARHTGTTITRQAFYTSNYSVGRFA